MKDIITTTLRISDTDYIKLKYIAKEEQRSLNSQMEFVLKKFISTYEKEHGAISLEEV